MTDTPNPELVQRLERCEIAAWGDFYRSAPETSRRACAVQLQRVAGASIAIAANVDVLALNRAEGLGLERPATADDIDEILRMYTSAHVPRFFVQLAPSAQPADMVALLENKGFSHYNNWVKLYRDVSPPPYVSTDLEVKLIDATHAAEFGRIVTSCFGWPESMEDWVAALVGRSGWRHFAAFHGSKPVATGSLFVDGDCGWIDFATTLPDYRGRGGQGAILTRRIRDAAELGCSTIVVETAEDRPDKSAPSYRNQIRYGFKVAYVRPNYIYEMK
jgi:GNAT superfamily N-acetyltransferase